MMDRNHVTAGDGDCTDWSTTNGDRSGRAAWRTIRLAGVRVARLAGYLRQPVEVLAFWAAVAFPLFYLALLFQRFDGTTGVLAFLGLLVANVLVLYVGHDHRRE